MAGVIGRVALIRHEDGVVVGPISKELNEKNISPIYSEYDERKIKMIGSMADAFILFLEGSADEMSDIAVATGEIAKTYGKPLIGVGEKEDCTLVEKKTGISFDEYYERPVDAKKFVEKLEDILTKGFVAKKEKTKVLIVDDDAEYAGILRGWLKDSYKVSVATDGGRAFSFLLKNKVDLVLLDYDMPIINGAQTLSMIPEDPTTKKIPVIFLTGVDDAESVKKVLELKPNGYLLKSSTKDTIVTRLKQFFDNKA